MPIEWANKPDRANGRKPFRFPDPVGQARRPEFHGGDSLSGSFRGGESLELNWCGSSDATSTLIAVTDVEASSRWYQRLLGCRSAHGGMEYERLVSNGALILQLHSFEVEHHHGPIGDPDDQPYGNGVLLWFELDDFDFDSAVARAAEMNAEVVKPRHRNPPSGDGGPNHWECWLRDPDGYTVVLASPDGSAG